MSLLQPVAPEITPTTEIVSLADIPTAEALAIDRSLHTFGPDIQSELGIDDEVVTVAEQESKALSRLAIRHSLPGKGATRTNVVLTNFEPNDTISHGEELLRSDENDFRIMHPERSDVHASTLRFITYCLLRQGARAGDRVLEKEAVDSLEWLESNKVTRPVVKEVLHPARRDMARTVGRILNRRRVSTLQRLA